MRSLMVIVLAAFPLMALEEKTLFITPLDPQYDRAAVSAYAASPTWQAWNTKYGGNWTAQLDTLTGKPRRVYGGAIPWPGDLEASARAFMAANPALFGTTGANLRYVPRLDTASGRVQYAAFDYFIDGIPVENGRIVFVVNGGNMIYWHATNIAAVPTMTTPSISAAAAARSVLTFAGVDAPLSHAPRLKLIPRNSPLGGLLQYRLVYEAAFRYDDRPWVAFVDALTGQTIAFGENSRYSSPGMATGGVRHALATDPEVVRPLPALKITTVSGEAISNPNGRFEFFRGALTSSLEGSFIRILCADCVKSEDDLQRGFQLFASSVGTGRLSFGTGGRDLIQGINETLSIANGTSTPAARSAYYSGNSAHALVRKWLAVPWLKTAQDVRVNFGAACNARWDGTTLTFFKAGIRTDGLQCANTGEIRDVVQHEWAHALDDHDGRFPGYALGHGDMATGEGMADLLAFFTDRDACIGHSISSVINGGKFLDDGQEITCTGVRNIDEKRTPEGLLTTTTALTACDPPAPRNNTGGTVPNEFLTGPLLRAAHCEGQIYGQAGFHLAGNLAAGQSYATGASIAGNPALDAENAWSVHERMFYESRPLVGSYAPSRFQAIGPSAYDGYLVVDDEGDGLANGTPHAAYVNDAFVHHGIEEWDDNRMPAIPDAANCGELSAPEVTITASVTGGLPTVTATWPAVPGATRYTLLRSDRANEAFLPIATVSGLSASDSGVQNGTSYVYRVEAGDGAPCERRSTGGVMPYTVAVVDPKFHGATIVDTPRGNGDGALDPGETAQVTLQLDHPATIVALQSLTAGVTVRSNANKPYTISLDESAALCDSLAEFRLTTNVSIDSFVLPVGCNIHKDVQVHAAAAIVDDRLGSGCGDGDLVADPGETVAVAVTLTDAGGREARDVTVAINSESPYLTIIGGASHFVTSLPAVVQFVATVGAAPVNGKGMVAVAAAGTTSIVEIPVNRDITVADQQYDFEESAQGWSGTWTHAAGLWASGYRSSQCDVLYSPSWELESNASLSFDLAYTTEDAFDGVEVQLTSDGGKSWQSVEPAGGYPLQATRGGCIFAGRGFFSGASPLPEQYTVDLGQFSGATVQVRFRMSSDNLIEQGAGAFLDNAVVRGARTIAPSAPCP